MTDQLASVRYLVDDAQAAIDFYLIDLNGHNARHLRAVLQEFTTKARRIGRTSHRVVTALRDHDR